MINPPMLKPARKKKSNVSIFEELQVDTSETDKTLQAPKSNFLILFSEYLRAEE
jgi:hypothetical protein